MKALNCALLLLLSTHHATLTTADLMVGERVCMTGFIMDTFCINRGTLLDAPSVVSLKNPELHSYHCMLDVGVCIDSGYQVLGSKDPINGLYCQGLRVDDTDKVVAAGRAHGTTESSPDFFSCSTCSGPDGNPIAGYQATIIGTVKELGDGLGRTTGAPGTDSVEGTPILTDIQVLDSTVACDPSIMVTVEADAAGNECLIRSTRADDDGSTPTTSTAATTAAATTTTTTTTTTAATTAITTTPAPPTEGEDCSSDFCETTLTDGYTLKYKINEADETITMEATYDGNAWLGIAFSEDEKMGGSDGVVGSPGGIPQKYRLNQGFIDLMPEEEQTLTDASVETIDGKTVMTFTKPLVEPDQIPITPGVNKMLWANGGASTTIGYHGNNRAPFSLNLNFNGSSSTKPAPSFKVGDEICTTGYIMDTFCIDRGTLLDAPDVVTLKNPDLHSFHCMFDVNFCIDSGYQVLGEKDPSTGEYCLGYRLEETDKVVAAGRAYGTTTSQSGFNSCTSCTGQDGNPIAGYLATVKGTIKELGDGSQSVSGQPLLTNIQMLDASEECANPAPQTTVCLPPPAEPEPPVEETPTFKVGDEICTTGYIMDTFCIDRGTLLDAPDVVTLKNPDLHSFHCMFDVNFCIDSGYQVLGEKDPSTGEYCLGYRLEETDKVVAAGRAYGTTTSQSGFNSCTTCTGQDGNPIAGYLATVKGTIKELGDGSQSVSGQPLLTNIQMLDASEECANPAPQTTVCLAPPDGASPASGTPSAGEKAPTADCSSVTCETTLTDGYTLRYKLNNPDAPDGTVTMELTYDGDAWLGIAFSEDERMGGSDGILGSPGGVPQKYRLFQGYIEIMPPSEQTLTDASMETTEDGKTVMKFTKLLVEPNQIPVTAGVNNMLWANGGESTTIGYHGTNRAPIQIDLASGAADAVSAPNMGAWLAHGICAFIAWGVLAPSAVNSAIYRSLFKGPLWFKLHQVFNASAYALTVVAFAIAVAFINKEGNPHFFSSHAKMGLSMFIIASVQVLWGAARPHLPEPDSGDEKTTIRKVWEIKHRLTGTVLLACGFWQMSAGIKLYAGKFNGVGSVQEQGVTIFYWIWIGIEVALLLIGGVYFKILKKPAEADGDGGNDAAAASVEEDKTPAQEKDDDAV